MKANNFSQFQITWVEFRATKSIVTKKDEKIITGRQPKGRNGNKLFMHFPNKQKAMSFVNENANKFKSLSKRYEVRTLTDFQFGKATNVNGEIIVDFTEKQENEMIVIG